jgi:hypothetical protein
MMPEGTSPSSSLRRVSSFLLLHEHWHRVHVALIYFEAIPI